jgi:hypothetical protein
MSATPAEETIAPNFARFSNEIICSRYYICLKKLIFLFMSPCLVFLSL